MFGLILLLSFIRWKCWGLPAWLMLAFVSSSISININSDSTFKYLVRSWEWERWLKTKPAVVGKHFHTHLFHSHCSLHKCISTQRAPPFFSEPCFLWLTGRLSKISPSHFPPYRKRQEMTLLDLAVRQHFLQSLLRGSEVCEKVDWDRLGPCEPFWELR